MAYKNILFDLDGTLTDPYPGMAKSLRYALDKFGIVEDSAEKIKRFIGPPLYQSFIEFYGFDEDKAKLAVGYYREYYSDKGLYDNKLYDNVDNLLKTLKDAGKVCVIATSKPQNFAHEVLKYLKIERYFDKVVGSNLEGTLYEKEDIIRFAIENGGLGKAETIMVGDRKYDILGARKNGIDSIAAAYGYGTMEELEESGPTHICRNVMDILEAVQK
jgi:phosphoglycolate phosphatase